MSRKVIESMTNATRTKDKGLLEPQPVQTSRVSLATGVFFLVGASIGAQVLAALTGFMVVRLSDPIEYGQFTTALALSASFGAAFLFGMDAVVIRKISRSPDSASTVVPSVLIPVIFWSFLLVGVIIGVGYLLDYSSEVMSLLWVVAPMIAVVNLGMLFRGVLRAFNRVNRDAVIRLLEKVVALLLAIGLLTVFGSIYGYAAALLIASVFGLVIAIAYTLPLVKSPVTFHSQTFRGILLIALPIGVAAVVSQSYKRLDTLVLSVYRDEQEVGFYGAAFSIVLLTVPLYLALSSAVFPTLAAHYDRNKDEFVHSFEQGLRYILIISLPIFVGVIILPFPIITNLFGNQYGPGSDALRVLGVTVLLISLSTYFWTTIVAMNEQKRLLLMSVLALATTIIIGLALIPRYGQVGAAWTTVAREATAVAVIAFFIVPKLPLATFTRAFRGPVASAIVLAIFLVLFSNYLSFWPLVILSGLVYVTMLPISRAITPAEIRSAATTITRIFDRWTH